MFLTKPPIMSITVVLAHANGHFLRQVFNATGVKLADIITVVRNYNNKHRKLFKSCVISGDGGATLFVPDE
jgi:hypothetical protein